MCPFRFHCQSMSLQRKKCNQGKEIFRWQSDFESTDSIYVNTNRKYSPEYSPRNRLELEASHLLKSGPCNAVISQKTNKRITYSPDPEAKYNPTESCVNMWWNFAVLFWIVYKASWPAKSSHRIQCNWTSTERVHKEKQKYCRIQPITLNGPHCNLRLAVLLLWELSFSALDLQKKCLFLKKKY